MNILITGVAGFIGFNLAKNLLSKNNIIYGIDNLDKFYSVKLKNKRINILKKNKNFKLYKIDINNKKNVEYFFKKNKINTIIHLAAQAGVRYSLLNPKKYIDTNIFGFLNLILAAKKKRIKKIIYASSSSVYGENNEFPLKESEKLNPKNIYGVSKKLNEDIAELYSKISNINFIGLRFFTVFGEWGRPDMFIMKLFKAHFLNKKFYLNNYGNHLRDFTYIEDVVSILDILVRKKIKGHKIFNICSNNPENIFNIVKNFKKVHSLKLVLIKMNKADILKTHGSNKKIINFISYNPFTSFYNAFYKTFNWYKNKKIYKID